MSESKRGVSTPVFVGVIVVVAAVIGGLVWMMPEVIPGCRGPGPENTRTPAPTNTPSVEVTGEDLHFIAELATANYRVVA